MDTLSREQRRDLAERARAFLAGTLSYDAFIDAAPDTRDRDAWALIDLIEHEPKRGGFLGVSETEWQAQRAELQRLISVLSA